ncbi:MAG: GNAT family N-acetyltransferase [Trueperaceae bacterium]|nr:GNAT family N-acetyltransferase [Trueperaceae bacterium]
MKPAFVSESFSVPHLVEQESYRLRPLTTNDVANDYEAVMSSRSSLRKIFSEYDKWPSDTMTLADNYRDLERHQREFDERQGFTYTVETPEGDKCLGCVYIYPTDKGDYEAQVFYWVTDIAKEAGLEEELGSFVRQWLKDVWPFKQVAYPGRDLSWQDWQALAKRTE